ncbi:MAG: bifunctional DNA-formamidopyrimidine glycosylase/DNA-(apurinic or apyrimidinic site) lyase [Spirochaetaceae bacterium]|nr:MAG: bifunctional DNA-formamidopyrimidine glycosylase/DNA-(apurinic or apyrimidinic site) lyase [Spirochaetaceae bacterium]
MPELPEVHTIIASLEKAGLPGSRIVSAWSERPNTVGGDLEAFRERVSGRQIAGLRRRGKYIILELLPERVVIIHLRMSGRLFLADTPNEAYVRAALQLDSDQWLCLYDPRRFARMECHDDLDDLFGRLGLEPLDDGFSENLLAIAIGVGTNSPTPIKARLLDQRRIAGIGNIYADEALFDSGIHPSFPASKLNPDQVQKLHAAIRTVLQRGINNLGTSLGHGKTNFSLPDGSRGGNQEDVRVFQRTGLPCVRCGRPIQRIVVAQRGTHFCPDCQPLLESE